MKVGDKVEYRLRAANVLGLWHRGKIWANPNGAFVDVQDEQNGGIFKVDAKDIVGSLKT